MSHHQNIELLERAARALGDLSEKFVFLGGTATVLLMTDPAAPRARASIDVDAIVRIQGHGDYHRLGKSLRQLGFAEDAREGAPVCRWRFDDLTLDVMPTDPEILGFGNRWYEHTLNTAEKVTLPSGRNIRLANAPCFLATKLEAFSNRGGGDYLASEDMEDVLAILDGRPELLDEIQASDTALIDYLANQMNRLLADRAFREAVPGHVDSESPSVGRSEIVFERMQAIAALPSR